YDYKHRYDMIERAMTLWREGENALWRAPWVVASVGEAHQRAIRVGVELLRRHETMSELGAAYYGSQVLAGEDALPGARENRRWVEYVCRVANAWQVNRSIVEDAAYFRRSRELILEATARS